MNMYQVSPVTVHSGIATSARLCRSTLRQVALARIPVVLPPLPESYTVCRGASQSEFAIYHSVLRESAQEPTRLLGRNAARIPSPQLLDSSLSHWFPWRTNLLLTASQALLICRLRRFGWSFFFSFFSIAMLGIWHLAMLAHTRHNPASLFAGIRQHQYSSREARS